MALTDVDTIEEGAEVKDGDERNQVPVNLSSQFADGDGVQLSGSSVRVLGVDFQFLRCIFNRDLAPVGGRRTHGSANDGR